MKKIKHLMMIALCSIMTLASCSKEEKSDPVNPLIEQMNGEYTESNQEKAFNLLYNGEAMPGKIASVTSIDGKTITIKLTGASLMPGMMENQSSSMIPSFGVVAGEKETVLTAEIVEAEDAKSFSFTGKDENGIREINFSGVIDDKKLDLKMDVKFTSKLAGTSWNLAPWVSDGQTIESQPIFINWETTGKVFLWQDAEYKPHELLILLSALPIFDGMYLQDAFCKVLKSVSFEQDGNLIAEYSKKENIKNPVWTKSGKNMVMYLNKDNQVCLEPNIQNILNAINSGMEASTKAEGSELNMQPLLAGLVKILPLISNGLPLTTLDNEKGMTLILDEKLALAIVKTLVPFMKDETNHAIIINTLKEKLNEIPMAGALISDVPHTVDSMIDVLEKSTKVQIGINLTK